MNANLRIGQALFGGKCRTPHLPSQARGRESVCALARSSVLSEAPAALKVNDAIILTPEDQEYSHDINYVNPVPSHFLDYQSASKQLSELEALSNVLSRNLQEIEDMGPYMRRSSEDGEKVEAVFRKQSAEGKVREQTPTSSGSSTSAPAASASRAVGIPPNILSEVAVDAQIIALTELKHRLDFLIDVGPQLDELDPDLDMLLQRQASGSAAGVSSSTRQESKLPMPSESAQGLSLLNMPPSVTAPQASTWTSKKQRRTSRLISHSPNSGQAGLTSSTNSSQASRSSTGRAKKFKGLTISEEQNLAKLVQDLLKLTRVKDEVAGILKREEAKALVVKMNRRLVIGMCYKYQRHIPFSDLVQVGIMGLMKGIEKFDASKGFRFSTYAHWWVRQAFTKCITEQSRSIRLPSHLYAELVKIKTYYGTHQKTHGHAPTTQMTADNLGLTRKRVEMILKLGQNTVSLDQPLGDEGEQGNTLLDTIECNGPDAEDEVEEVLLKREIDTILQDFSHREAEIIRLRFGLNGNKEMALQMLGQHFGISRERVRQIEAKVLNNLRMLPDDATMRVLKELSMTKGEDLTAKTSSGTKKT
eukprot:gene7840-1041_t